MRTLRYAQQWIEHAWMDMGRHFDAAHVPVARFHELDADDMSFPFKNDAIESWFLSNGKFVADPSARILQVPFVAFSVNEDENTMSIQLNWASRCGYGFEIAFDDQGDVKDSKMLWIS